MINKKTKVLVQGITGSQGKFHTKLMLDYGTNIVAGVTPGKRGVKIHGVPVYDSIKEAKEEINNIEWSVIFVPAKFAKQAAFEALTNGLNIVLITEHIIIKDVMQIVQLAKEKNKVFIGPNCPGVISVDNAKLGIMPNHIFKKGDVGIVSRSGTLTYEIVHELTKKGIGQSTCIGIGGDAIKGYDFIDALKFFEQDENTKKIIFVGEIGGNSENLAADYIKENISKPVVGYIAGVSAPANKQMGHAGAIIDGKQETAAEKIKYLRNKGIKVADIVSSLFELL